MRISPTLSLYVGRHFLFGFLALFFIFLMIILTFDTIELMRRSAAKPDIGLSIIVEMALLKLPHMGQMLFPFAALFGAMAVFWHFTRHHELVVTRAAGVSAWQFLFPVLIIGFLLGVFKVTILNPFAATLLTRYERLESVEFKGEVSALAVSRGGIWLRQGTETGQSVIHATHVLQQGRDIELRNVIVFIYEGANHLRRPGRRRNGTTRGRLLAHDRGPHLGPRAAADLRKGVLAGHRSDPGQDPGQPGHS